MANKRKKELCKDLGANLVIIYTKEDFFKTIHDYTNGEGVDVILDIIGNAYFSKNLSLLRDRGRLISIAFLSGKDVKLDLSMVLKKELQ